MAVEDISYAVEKLLEELATNSPNLTTSDMTAIKAAIAGEGRLVLTEINCRTCKYDLSIPPPRCYNCSHFDKWEPRQERKEGER